MHLAWKLFQHLFTQLKQSKMYDQPQLKVHECCMHTVLPFSLLGIRSASSVVGTFKIGISC